MDFSLTTEQEELRRTVRAVVEDRGGFAAVRTAMTAGGEDRELWRRLAGELGLAGLGVPEERGGVGGGFLDAAVVLEETGRWVLPVPYLATVVATAVATSDPTAGELVAGLAAGEQTAAVVVDGGLVVGGADPAVVVAGADGAARLLRRAEVALEPVVGMDQTRPVHRLRSAPVDAVTGVGADLLMVGLALEAAGGARWCLESTVGYLKVREQFGRPVGAFQAVQHRCADLAVEVETAASVAYAAAWAAAERDAELAVLAPLAKAYCSAAYLHAAAEAIQLHGGIGFTWEHDAHLHLKRAKSTELLLGGPVAERRRLAARVGLFRAAP